MKILRFAIAAMLLVLTGSVVSAQQSKTDETLEFKPHWTLGLQGGVAHTVGETSFGNLISPAAAVSAQWHFHHAFGLRLGVSGWQGKGAVWEPDALVYPFKYAQVNADLVMGLADIFGGFNHKRVCNPYIFAGVGGAYGFDNKAAAVASEVLTYYWENKFFVPVRTGLGVDFRLGDVVSLGLEGGADIYSDKFNSKKADNADWQLSLLAGLKFRLGDNTRPSKAYAEKQAALEAAAEAERVAAQKLADKKAAEAKAAAEKAAAEKAAAEKAAAEKAAAEKAARIAAGKKQFDDADVKDIFFLIGSSQLRKAEDAKIVKIAEMLKEYPEFSIELVGYADKVTGTPNRNMKLSQMRAEAVSARLVELGINAERIMTDYKGCTVQPSNKPEESRVVICTLK